MAVEIDAQSVEMRRFVDAYGVMGGKLGEERDEIAVTMPFQRELKVRKAAQTLVAEESLGESAILVLLYFLMMIQEKLYHTSVLCVQGILIFRIKIVLTILLEYLCHNHMLFANNLLEQIPINNFIIIHF